MACGVVPSSSIQDAIVVIMDDLLDAREYPKTICPSEVARSLSSDQLSRAGAKSWREMMSSVREVAWSMRSCNRLEVLQRGQLVAEDVALADITGPIRLRRPRSGSG